MPATIFKGVEMKTEMFTSGCNAPRFLCAARLWRDYSQLKKVYIRFELYFRFEVYIRFE